MSAHAHPQPGEELDWLATDIHGHVGLFSTGGRGPVPATVTENRPTVEAAVKALGSLPVVSDLADKPTEPGDFSFWIEPARRGIYGFEWGPVSAGGYTQITTPRSPIVVGDIDIDVIRQAALLVQLPVAFEEARNLAGSAILVPLYGGPV